MFGTLIYWDGEYGIIRSKATGILFNINRLQVSPWHIPVFKEGINIACSVNSDGIYRIEHADGDWDWLLAA